MRAVMMPDTPEDSELGGNRLLDFSRRFSRAGISALQAISTVHSSHLQLTPCFGRSYWFSELPRSNKGMPAP
jgi:hypothetical protein